MTALFPEFRHSFSAAWQIQSSHWLAVRDSTCSACASHRRTLTLTWRRRPASSSLLSLVTSPLHIR